MMAPPRLQCLNASRQAVKSMKGMRAAFSTTTGLRADDFPPSRSSAHDLLSTLSSAPSNSPRTPPTYTNPIRTPRIPSGNTQANMHLANLLNKHTAKNAATRGRQGSVEPEDVKRNKMAKDLSKQITRRWREGDVYAPHDLSEVEMAKWKQRDRPTVDAFDVLDMNPMDYYRNFSIMSEYMTPMGRIKHSKETGLRPKNQRRIARAIRRSIGMGMMPSVHRHPEILYKMTERHEMNSPVKDI